MSNATDLAQRTPNYQRIFVDQSSYQREERSLGPVEEIVVRGAMDVYIVRAKERRMVIAGETAEAIRSIETNTAGERLVIRQRGAGTTLNLGDVFISARGTININGAVITSARAAVALALPVVPSIVVEGSGSVVVVDADQPTIAVNIRGTGSVTASGRVDRLAVSVAGTGDMDATQLECRDANLKVAGTGDIEAFVTQSVDASAMGTGDITIYGNPPRRNQSVTGLGDIRFR